MISYPLKQSSTSQPLLFLLVASTDHVAPVTGATPTVVLRKPGGSFASPSGLVTEIGNGWYQVAGNATDTNTLGPLILHATATGADPCDVIYPVVAFDPQAATNLGLSALPTASPASAGGLPTVGTGSGQVNPASGKVPATLSSADVSGNVAADLQTIKTQAVTCAGGVTVPAATLASTTNITTVGAVSGAVGSVTGNVGGSVASVTAAVTLPSIPANWITAAGVAASASSAFATAVWTDLTTGADFAVSNSIGRSLAAAATVQDLASAILVTPANKLATDASGRVLLAAAGLDAVPIDGLNARQLLAVLGALVGKRAGLPNGPLTLTGVDGSTVRVSTTFDPSGNTTAITITPPA
ncbi:hypothetical protein [Aquisphaera insulae]|uniref:hypothetical protein n=1 Tax=Aquisphaera insulae TaxID=2712864 RepID=UPI0013ECF3F9|nr:hypothetical protein [Aquisphaera insulae]